MRSVALFCLISLLTPLILYELVTIDDDARRVTIDDDAGIPTV